MWERKILLISIIIAELGIVSQAMARDGKIPERKTILTQPASKVFTAMGRVTGNDSKKSTITISTNRKGPLTLVIDKNSEITRGRKNIMASEICWNDFVVVSYEIIKGKNIAKSIIVRENQLSDRKK